MLIKELKSATKKLLTLTALISITLIFINRYNLANVSLDLTPTLILGILKIIVTISAIAMGLTLFSEEYSQNAENYLFSNQTSRMLILRNKITAIIILIGSSLILISLTENIWFPPGTEKLTVNTILPSSMFLFLIMCIFFTIPFSYFRNTAIKTIGFAAFLAILTPSLQILGNFVISIKYSAFSASKSFFLSLLGDHPVSLVIILLILSGMLYYPFISGFRRSGGISGRYSYFFFKNLAKTLPVAVVAISVTIYVSFISSISPSYFYYLLRNGNLVTTSYYSQPEIDGKKIDIPGTTISVTGENTPYFLQIKDTFSPNIFSYNPSSMKINKLYSSNKRMLSFHLKHFQHYIMLFTEEENDAIVLKIIDTKLGKVNTWPVKTGNKKPQSINIIKTNRIGTDTIDMIISVMYPSNFRKHIFHLKDRKPLVPLGESIKYPRVCNNYLITFTHKSISFKDLSTPSAPSRTIEGNFEPGQNYMRGNYPVINNSNNIYCLRDKKHLVTIAPITGETKTIYSSHKPGIYLTLYSAPNNRFILITSVSGNNEQKIHKVSGNKVQLIKHLKEQAIIRVMTNGIIIRQSDKISTETWETLNM